MFWSNPKPSNHHPERGNVFAIILIGVVLFAALIFVVSRGLDTGATRLTSSQARNFATDIITYSGQVERAVASVIENGVSETDISFENGIVAGYTHAPAATDREKIFGTSDGGGMTWKSPLSGQTPSSSNKWLITGGVVVTGQDSNSLSDLIITLPVAVEVCTEINRQLNVGIDLTSDQGTVTGAKFTGTYTDNAAVLVAPGTGIISGCFKGLITDGAQAGEYTFYRVLISR